MENIYENVAAMMQKGGVEKFYLLHTLSHIIMKELESSCGYPTASLKERLYFSERMCGVLIYTADGSEGSMGGLVWQGQPELIENIIMTALNRGIRTKIKSKLFLYDVVTMFISHISLDFILSFYGSQTAEFGE